MIIGVSLNGTRESPILMAVRHAGSDKDERRVFLSLDSASDLAAALANLCDAVKRL